MRGCPGDVFGLSSSSGGGCAGYSSDVVYLAEEGVVECVVKAIVVGHGPVVVRSVETTVSEAIMDSARLKMGMYMTGLPEGGHERSSQQEERQARDVDRWPLGPKSTTRGSLSEVKVNKRIAARHVTSKA